MTAHAFAADSKFSNRHVTFESNSNREFLFEFESNLEASQVPTLWFDCALQKSRGDLKIAGRSQEWSVLSNTSQPVTPQVRYTT